PSSWTWRVAERRSICDMVDSLCGEGEAIGLRPAALSGPKLLAARGLHSYSLFTRRFLKLLELALHPAGVRHFLHRLGLILQRGLEVPCRKIASRESVEQPAVDLGVVKELDRLMGVANGLFVISFGISHEPRPLVVSVKVHWV